MIQVYGNDLEVSVIRLLKELKAFNKVNLNPGETKIVTLEIPVNELAFFDDSKMDWKLEAGQFKLMLGNSSRNIEKTIDIEIQ